jgi:hypothetical protein
MVHTRGRFTFRFVRLHSAACTKNFNGQSAIELHLNDMIDTVNLRVLIALLRL